MVGTVSNFSVATFGITDVSKQTPGYDISASNGYMFPWMSRIAQGYEKFRFNKLRFELISSNPTSTAGRVYMSVDPDYDDPLPATKSQLCGYITSVDAPVWDTVSLTVPMARLNSDMPWRFCSSSSRNGPGEPRTAYAGFLVIGVDTPSINLTWDLWVDYEVELMEPTSELLEVAIATDTSNPVAYTVYNPPLTLGTRGGLRIRTAAAANVPATIPSGVFGTALPVNSCIEIPVSGHGTLSYDVFQAIAGSTPATVMSTFKPYIDGALYDTIGNFLGKLSDGTLGSWFNRVIGPPSGLYINPGDGIVSHTDLLVEKVLENFRTVRYIVLALVNAAAMTPTSFSGSLKYEL